MAKKKKALKKVIKAARGKKTMKAVARKVAAKAKKAPRAKAKKVAETSAK